MVTEEARRVADVCGGPNKHRVMQMADEIDRQADQLVRLQQSGQVSGDSNCGRGFKLWAGI